ncbi:uncharacterized protein [Rutidosis leptorrhynchoides]|uniref:uncharacterized protein n=1 Tax=Rutidosis leptorrhynchoides TaxID=125765 RepID=UPI003A994B5B
MAHNDGYQQHYDLLADRLLNGDSEEPTDEEYVRRVGSGRLKIAMTNQYEVKLFLKIESHIGKTTTLYSFRLFTLCISESSFYVQIKRCQCFQLKKSKFCYTWGR